MTVQALVLQLVCCCVHPYLLLVSLSLLLTIKCIDAISVMPNPGTVHVSARAAAVESFKVMDVLQRANELQAQGFQVLHCEVGQPETGAPTTVADAAVAALLEPQVMGYTDAFGLLELREKISQHYTRYYGLPVWEQPNPSRIVITTGSSGGFLLAFTACFDAGDTVAIASSGYPCYRNILSALGCHLANVPINTDFKLTAAELNKEITRRREAEEAPLNGLILSSPSNPTGAMLSPNELCDLCQLCHAEGIQFLSDEIYHGISYGKPEATALAFSSTAIVLNSFSKYYSSKLSYDTVCRDECGPNASVCWRVFCKRLCSRGATGTRDGQKCCTISHSQKSTFILHD
jgi:aspartate/methionine/tyrosine aminotransferase